MLRRISTVLITAAITLTAAAAAGDPGNSNGKNSGQPKMFGKGHPFTLSELPPGRIQERLDSLPLPAYRNAMDWLHRFDFPVNDLESLIIDDAGAVLYADPAPADLSSTGEQAAAADGASPQPAAYDENTLFALHSRPDAAHAVYLDFDGHSFSGTAWSSGTINARPFDLDGAPSTFNATERNAIAEIWHRVAEDFAAFDIDVTTEEPASFGPNTGRVLITSKTDANGAAMPYGTAGGVAYVGVWGRSDYASKYSPALVYYDNLAKTSTYIAEASSHEFGHNMGLSHDGTGSVTYYAGHGSGATSWAPIMGNSYYNNVTQWSSGEYAGANNTQDDLAIIASKLDLVDDDHGDSLNSASPLLVESNGQILVSNPETDPHNSYSANKGVIEEAGDQDLFYFSAAAGQVDIEVIPAWDAFYRTSKRGANLDIQASLLSANGATLATSDPTSDTYANIVASVPTGTYYLKVTGVGNGNYSDYASAGQYFIAGSVVPGEALQFAPTADLSFSCTNLSCDFTDNSTDSDGIITARSWNFGDASTSASQNPSHTYASADTYNVTLTVTDDDGLTASTSRSVTVSAPNSLPTANFGFSCTGLVCNFSDTSSDSDGTIAGRSWNFDDGSTSTSQNPSHTYASAGNYSVRLTVTDNDGATSAASTHNVTVEAIQDTVAPTVFIDSPSVATDASGTLTLAAHAVDDQQVTQIDIYVGEDLRCSGISSASCNWNLRKVASGSYTIIVKAMDAAGNEGSASVTVNVTGGNTKGGGGGDSTTTKGKGRVK